MTLNIQQITTRPHCQRPMDSQIEARTRGLEHVDNGVGVADWQCRCGINDHVRQVNLCLQINFGG